tara:strand:+ start:5845 stop:6651 length:807 start_codon:yes stop_codon:yes gene_type:complete
MKTSNQFTEFQILAAKKRKQAKLKHEKSSNESRNNSFPIAISFVSTGLFLLVLWGIFGLFSTTILKGDIINKGGIIGPIEVSSSELHDLKIDYSIKNTGSLWCSLSVLLLDENKNVITGSNKDLYYESGFYETNEDSQMEYEVFIEEPGIYYYQLLPQHQKGHFNFKKIQYSLNHQFVGNNLLFVFGIIILVIGALYCATIFFDWELSSYIPNLKSKQSITLIKQASLVFVPLLILFVIISFFKVGYADFKHCPSNYFNNNHTHYFGK